MSGGRPGKGSGKARPPEASSGPPPPPAATEPAGAPVARPAPGPGDLVRARAVVRGIVQGVCYRAETRYQAEMLGLSGWVRNLADGSVEVLVEGPRETVERLLAWCWKGPEYARVDGVEIRWEEHRGEFPRFGIGR
jgi:acylphosphatase